MVSLRFFAGLTIEQAVAALRVSTADNDRAYARCWLRLGMDAGGDDTP